MPARHVTRRIYSIYNYVVTCTTSSQVEHIFVVGVRAPAELSLQMVSSIHLRAHELKVVSTLCVIELSRALLTKESRAGTDAGCPVGSFAHTNVERAVVMTTANFFWKTLREGSIRCPIQIIVTCVQLARNALELHTLSVTTLCSLYLNLFESVSAKLDSVTLHKILGTGCVQTFMEELPRVEFEILEKLEFSLVACSADGQLEFLRCDSVEEEFLFTLKAVILCLYMVEQSSKCDSKLLSECGYYITSLTYEPTCTSKANRYVMTKTRKISNQLQALLVDVFTLLELSDLIL